MYGNQWDYKSLRLCVPIKDVTKTDAAFIKGMFYIFVRNYQKSPEKNGINASENLWNEIFCVPLQVVKR